MVVREPMNAILVSNWNGCLRPLGPKCFLKEASLSKKAKSSKLAKSRLPRFLRFLTPRLVYLFPKRNMFWIKPQIVAENKILSRRKFMIWIFAATAPSHLGWKITPHVIQIDCTITTYAVDLRKSYAKEWPFRLWKWPVFRPPWRKKMNILTLS